MPDHDETSRKRVRPPFIDPQVLEDLTIDTAARLARPDAFLIIILRRYWAEATEEEATAAWVRTVQGNPGYAIDVINCLDQIVADPPVDLISLIVDQGRVMFDKTTVGGLQPYESADYLQWLADVSVEWTAILNASIA